MIRHTVPARAVLLEIQVDGVMPHISIKTDETQDFGDPGEGPFYLERFLEMVGYPADQDWELRIKGHGHTKPTSPPVVVVGFRRPAILVRIKISLHSGNYLEGTLQVPEGSDLNPREVAQKLRNNVKPFNRFARSHNLAKNDIESSMNAQSIQPDGTVTDPSGAGAAPAEAGPSNELEFDTLTGVTRHPEKLRYVLTFVDQASKTAPGSAMGFKKALRKAAGWQDQPIRAVALVLAWLCKHGYVVKIRDQHDQVINYRLTPRGASLAFSGMGAASGPAPVPLSGSSEIFLPPMVGEFDPGTLLIRFREKAQELADAGRRLEENRTKYRDLQVQLKQLDEEYNEIGASSSPTARHRRYCVAY